MTPKRTLITVIIPCYNSRNYLKKTVSEILTVFSASDMKNLSSAADIENPNSAVFQHAARQNKTDISGTGKFRCCGLQLILIDDASPDKTFEIIEELCGAAFPNKPDANICSACSSSAISAKATACHVEICGIRLDSNHGQNRAKMTGIPFIKGDYCIFMDDDGQHDPRAIPLLIQKIDEGYDLVYAQFPKRRESPFRSLASHITELMLTVFNKKPRGIQITSFFALSRASIDYLQGMTEYAQTVGQCLFPHTDKIAGIKIPHRSRSEGSSNYSYKKLFSLWWHWLRD